MLIPEEYVCTTPGCDCQGLTNDEYINKLATRNGYNPDQLAALKAIMNKVIKKETRQ